MSAFNFEYADVATYSRQLEHCQQMCLELVAKGLPLAAYEHVLQASHAFNLLDARHALSVTERQRLILRIRQLSGAVAKAYVDARQALGFPLLGGTDDA